MATCTYGLHRFEAFIRDVMRAWEHWHSRMYISSFWLSWGFILGGEGKVSRGILLYATKLVGKITENKKQLSLVWALRAYYDFDQFDESNGGRLVLSTLTFVMSGPLTVRDTCDRLPSRLRVLFDSRIW